MAFYPDPTIVPPLGIPKSNTFTTYTYTTEYILKLRHKYILILKNNQFTVNTLIYAQRTLLVLSYYSNSNILYLQLQFTP